MALAAMHVIAGVVWFLVVRRAAARRRADVARSELSALERRWLADPPQALARIATVDADGMPHVALGGWSFDPATEEMVLGGRDVPRTQRAPARPGVGPRRSSLTGSLPGRGSPWAFVVRGRAWVDDDLG